ncbi:hypothetical protein BU26DRAFT_34523 [Trematosphaeria pertusa]|uniref:Uncharacterized protein n=1 Tax=Trematosphaeria pertusa TaxID=390896 RepID=A0A6A6J494_9PLEO|nr:uncharacterized protein BU26DRAFT_34523 [Trematosphaeria pertusa]KAF2257042.1 hypothetical protein BU26DRAFT_34523 [Trematosphaeria pertusa]
MSGTPSRVPVVPEEDAAAAETRSCGAGALAEDLQGPPSCGWSFSRASTVLRAELKCHRAPIRMRRNAERARQLYTIRSRQPCGICTSVVAFSALHVKGLARPRGG